MKDNTRCPYDKMTNKEMLLWDVNFHRKYEKKYKKLEGVYNLLLAESSKKIKLRKLKELGEYGR